MAIARSGCFDYTVRLHRRSPNAWGGRAAASADQSLHPGLAGERPEIELVNGGITIASTESWIRRRTSPHYRDWGPPASTVRVAVGPAFEAVAREGDVLTIYRAGTGDLAATLVRGDDLQLHVGSISAALANTGIVIEEDPRAQEVQLYGILRSVADPDTSLIWVDASDPQQREPAIQAIHRSRAKRLIIAVAGEDPAERRRVNHRLADTGAPLPRGRSSCWYVDVDARFRSREAWLDYLHGLPESRPTDLWIRFATGGTSTVVGEGECAFTDPWHLFVARVFRPGLPGELSRFAIARNHAAISNEMVSAASAMMRLEIEAG